MSYACSREPDDEWELEYVGGVLRGAYRVNLDAGTVAEWTDENEPIEASQGGTVPEGELWVQTERGDWYTVKDGQVIDLGDRYPSVDSSELADVHPSYLED